MSEQAWRETEIRWVQGISYYNRTHWVPLSESLGFVSRELQTQALCLMELAMK